MEYTYKYPRPAVTADCIVITREAEPKVLLIQRGNQPYNTPRLIVTQEEELSPLLILQSLILLLL